MELLGSLQRLLVRTQSLEKYKVSSDTRSPPGASSHLVTSLQTVRQSDETIPETSYNWLDDLTNGASLLGSQIQRLVLLALVELSQVLLLLLVHHGVDPGDTLPDHPDLAQLGRGSPGHLGHSQLSQLSLEITQLLGQVFLVLLAQLGALDLTHLYF